MTKTSKNNESSVLFNIQGIMKLQDERTRREEAEAKAAREAAEARRLEATLLAHAEKEQERQLAEHLRAEAELLERERCLAEREADIRARVDLETAEQIEAMRQAYAEAPVELPRNRFRTLFSVSAMALAIMALSTFAVVSAMGSRAEAAQANQSAALVAVAAQAVPTASPTVAEAPKSPEKSPVTAPAPADKPRVDKPRVVKPRYKHVKRCRTKTVVVKRVRKAKCSALEFDGCYRNITKKVKTCRTVRVRVR